VLTEFDVTGFNEANVRQNDTVKFRHLGSRRNVRTFDQHLRDSREPLELRDNGISTEATNLDPPFPAGCGTKPVGTRVSNDVCIGVRLRQVVKWVQNGTAAATVPVSRLPRSGTPPSRTERLGLAQGGIQLSQMIAPTRVNSGTNTGPGACNDGASRLLSMPPHCTRSTGATMRTWARC
jgi:hypothetical protein